MRRSTLLVPVLLMLAVVLPAAHPAYAAPARWGWPLPGRPAVLRPFQPPPGPYAPGHRGVDLAGSVGTPVLAAGDGVVRFAAPLAGRGVVTVVHGALRTTYEPVRAVVRVGQRVVRGEQIGWLAPPTGHCGPGVSCLHWGLLRGSTYLDPLSLLGPVAVRLLPVNSRGGGAGGGKIPGAGDPLAAGYATAPPTAAVPPPERDGARASATGRRDVPERTHHGPAAAGLAAAAGSGAVLLLTRRRRR